MAQERFGPAMNCLPWARLLDFITLAKGRGATENWTPADDQLFSVNRAKKCQIIWGFPGFLPHCSCPISKHAQGKHHPSCLRSFCVPCFFVGISAGPFDELYLEVSTFGVANWAPKIAKSTWILRLQCVSVIIRRGQTAPAALPASALMQSYSHAGQISANCFLSRCFSNLATVTAKMKAFQIYEKKRRLLIICTLLGLDTMTGLLFTKAALLKMEIEYLLYLYVYLQLWSQWCKGLVMLWLKI